MHKFSFLGWTYAQQNAWATLFLDDVYTLCCKPYACLSIALYELLQQVVQVACSHFA